MEKIKKLRKIFNREKIDGYIIPKNDEFFGEYVPEHNDRLKFISGFNVSYGFALVLRNKNYLFVDGRYSVQAQINQMKDFSNISSGKFSAVLPPIKSTLISSSFNSLIKFLNI